MTRHMGSVIKSLSKESRKTRKIIVPQRVQSFKNSFPLDGGRGLGGNIVDDAIDTRHLIDDADGNTIQHIVGNAGPVSSHEVGGGDAAERQRIVIRPAIAHNAHGAHIGQHRKVLIHGALQMRLGDLIPEDEVRQTQGVQLLLGDLADDADGKAGTGEGLAHDQILRQAQLPA